jgi:hypothetical protein
MNPKTEYLVKASPSMFHAQLALGGKHQFILLLERPDVIIFSVKLDSQQQAEELKKERGVFKVDRTLDLTIQ